MTMIMLACWRVQKISAFGPKHDEAISFSTKRLGPTAHCGYLQQHFEVLFTGAGSRHNFVSELSMTYLPALPFYRGLANLT